MTAARPLPELGSIHLDARGADRVLRVSWHTERELVVLSLWRDNVCSATFRLGADEVADLIDVLQAGLDVIDLAEPLDEDLTQPLGVRVTDVG